MSRMIVKEIEYLGLPDEAGCDAGNISVCPV